MSADIELERERLWTDYRAKGRAQKALAGDGIGPLGLAPEKIRVTEAYQTALRETNAAFATLRAFNTRNPPPRRERTRP